LSSFYGLPSAAFYPFKVQKVAKADVLWQQTEKFSKFDPADYAFVVTNLADCNGLEQKSILAERYGGAGVGHNAGGARCGLLGDVQIKGVGRNPLAGFDTDYWHQEGSMSVQDCIKEVVFSEIFDKALPWGTVRNFAAVDINKEFQVEIGESKSKGTARRGLLLREAALRPAHFMRASGFTRTFDSSPIIKDIERMRLVIPEVRIAWMNSLSKRTVSGFEVESDSKASMQDIVNSTFQRLADQIAASRAKRLHHGSLIPSNYSVDGRLLDFGTSTGLETFSDYVTSPGAASVWSQDEPIGVAIFDLCFYFNKFQSKAHLQLNPNAIWDNFLAHLRDRQKQEMIKVTGIPICVWNQIETGTRDSFWKVFEFCLGQAKQQRIYYYGDDRHKMDAASSIKDLIQLVELGQFAITPSEFRIKMVEIGVPKSVADNLAVSFFELLKQSYIITRASHSSWSDFRVKLAFRSAAWCLDRAPLFRRNIDQTINDIVQNGGAVNQLIDSLVSHWSNVFSEKLLTGIATDPWLTSDKLSINDQIALIESANEKQAYVSQKHLSSIVSEEERVKFVRLFELSVKESVLE
jgi:hypothetical protein